MGLEGFMRNLMHSRALLTGASSLAVALIVAQPAFAQDAPANTTADEEQADASEIVVTGTSLRGVAPVGSPIVQLGHAEIEKLGVQTAGQMLATIPQLNSFATTPATGPGGGAPTTPPALRNLSPSATLSLLNGHRLVGLGAINTTADPTSLPFLAFERVEVLADGASATYGSDAVAGVVNVILRKKLDGVEMQGTYGTASKYWTYNLSGAFGQTWDSGNFMIAGQYQRNRALGGLDRSYVTNDFTAFGGTDQRTINTPMPNTTVGGTTYGFNGTGFIATPNKVSAGSYTDLIPTSKRISAVMTFNQDLSDSATFFADAHYGNVITDVRSLAAQTSFTITSSNPFFRAPVPGATSADVNIALTDIFGTYFVDRQRAEFYGANAGVDIALSDKWNVQFTGGFGHSDTGVFSDGFNGAGLSAAVAGTTTATAFDPYGGLTSAATRALIRDQISDAGSSQRLLQFGGKLDGSLFSLPGGDVKVALGAEYRYDGFARTGLRSAPTFALPSTTRNVTSLYAEGYFPLVGEDNAVPGIARLAFNGAVRYDHYSDFGSTWNPKFGVEWSPIDILKIRASYGTSFHAPSQADLAALDTRAQPLAATLFPGIFTPPGVTTPQNVLLLAGGNPDLKPETSKSLSVGFDLQATPNLRFSGTYYKVKYSNMIDLAWGTIFTVPALEDRLVVYNPTDAQITAAIGTMPVWGTLFASGDTDLIVDLRRYNLGIKEVQGLDFDVSYRLPTSSAGNFNFGIAGNYQLKNSSIPVVGVAATDNLVAGFNPKFRLRGSLGWDYNAFNANLFVTHISGYNNTNATPVQRVSSWTSVDANFNYTIGDIGFGKDVKLMLNLSNVFDTKPPLVIGGNGVSMSGVGSAVSPIGRMVEFGLKASF
jgi:iron complex outermembrane recepter protein